MRRKIVELVLFTAVLVLGLIVALMFVSGMNAR